MAASRLTLFALLFPLAAFATATPKAKKSLSPHGRLMGALTRELTEYKKLAALKEERIRIGDALTIAHKERMRVFRRRDTTQVRINGFKRILKKRRRRLGKLVGAYYKISRSRFGRPFLSHGGVQLPANGQPALKKILKRAKEEISLIEKDLLRLKDQKARLNETLESYKKIIMRLTVRKTEIAASVARCDHALKQISLIRIKMPKSLYDAEAWKVWQAIVDLRKKYGKRVLPFKNLRGVLARPVPGVWLKDRTGSKGVYISAKPQMNVRAPEAGTVRFTGKVKGYGEVVIIEHRESYYSLIGRLEQIEVKVGQRIPKSQIVAKAAKLGNAPYVPVYYELRKGTTYLNPKLWLK